MSCIYETVCKEWYDLLIYCEVGVADFEEFCENCSHGGKGEG